MYSGILWFFSQQSQEKTLNLGAPAHMRTSFLTFMTITISPGCSVTSLQVEIHIITGRGEGGGHLMVDMGIKNLVHGNTKKILRPG